MGKIVVALALLVGCGKVIPGGDDEPPGVDAPSCTSCIANGDSCNVDGECMSNECVCNDNACAAKICGASACACGFTSDGTSCDGSLATGITDSTCSAGCDGTGTCEQPVLWFKFDEIAGNTLANSGTWPGTLARSGGTSGVAGQLGNAVLFSQATDGIVIDDPADNSLDNFASWTVDVWVNFSALPNNSNITFVKKDNAYICRGVVSGGVFFHQSIIFTPQQEPANSSMTLPALNTWNHAACSYDGFQLQLYWNGTLVSTAPVNGLLSNSTTDLGIAQSTTNTENFSGMMDELRMWSTPRTARQICIAACGSFDGTTCTFDNDCSN